MVGRRRIALAGGAYFGVVFCVGFVLGTVRVLGVVPVLGERMAELLEIPLMLFASFLGARWAVRRFSIPADGASRLGVGAVALGLLVGAEILVVLQLQGATLREFVAGRDPVSGSVYVVSLVLFALMPRWVER